MGVWPLLSTQAAKEYGDHAVPNIHAMHGWQHAGKSTGHRPSRGHSIGMHSHFTTYKVLTKSTCITLNCAFIQLTNTMPRNLLNANMVHNIKESQTCANTMPEHCHTESGSTALPRKHFFPMHQAGHFNVGKNLRQAMQPSSRSENIRFLDKTH